MGCCDRAAMITAIACLLMERLSTEAAEQLAADLVQLGDTMDAMLVCKEHEQTCRQRCFPKEKE